MTKESFQELSIAVLLIIALVLFFDPLMVLMPGAVGMFVIVAAVVLLFAFIMFFWKERPRDEREVFHSMLASRNGWLAGAIVLMVGLVLQGLEHQVDPWLVYTLVIMIIAKVISHRYSRQVR